jgi:anaerobic ribonucleoside-triphosphate reductase activating protein
MTTIRVNRVHYPVTVLGPGVRLGIWFQGCSIGCRGCVSRDTWDPAGALPRPVAEVLTCARALVDGPIDGVTITGGEPFEQPDGLDALLAALRDEFPGCDLLAYSGYELDHLRRSARPAVDRLDAVVTGPYLAGKPSPSAWWGSANQVLTTLTDLGTRRYATVPGESGLQVDVGEDGVIRVIGIPRSGVLPQVERHLRRAGVQLEEVSWRP